MLTNYDLGHAIFDAITEGKLVRERAFDQAKAPINEPRIPVTTDLRTEDGARVRNSLKIKPGLL